MLRTSRLRSCVPASLTGQSSPGHLGPLTVPRITYIHSLCRGPLCRLGQKGPGSLFIRQLSDLSCCKTQGLVVFPVSHKAPVTIETVKASFCLGVLVKHTEAVLLKADGRAPDALSAQGPRSWPRLPEGSCSDEENLLHPLGPPPALRGAIVAHGSAVMPFRGHGRVWGDKVVDCIATPAVHPHTLLTDLLLPSQTLQVDAE